MQNPVRSVLFTSLLAVLFGVSVLSAGIAAAEDDRDSGSTIEVAKYVQGEDNEWQAAHDSWKAEKIEVGDPVNWKIKIENDSEQPVQVVISDTLDGQPFDLSAHCTLPTDGVIAADDTWVCEYETFAEEGQHINVVMVQVDQNAVSTAQYQPNDGPLVKKASAAYYGVLPAPGDVISFEVEKQVKDADGGWKDADRLWDALKVEPNDELGWRIAIVNKEEAMIAVTLTDMMDGAVMDISADCPGPDGNIIEAGATYTCELSSTAEAGAHANVIAVSAVMGEASETDRDVAFYVAKQYYTWDDYVEVEKMVRIGDGEWLEADRIKDALVVDAGDELQWLIVAENESGMDVTLTMTDTLNGQPADLSGCAVIPEPFPADAEYSCEYNTTAVAGPNVNFAVVIAEADGVQSIDRDAAVAVGLPLSFQLRENLVISKEVKLDDGEWQDADRLYETLYAPVGANLNWRIGVANNNEVTATVALTDHMDGAIFDLPDDCETEAEMTPGATLSCSFTSTAEAGYHVNVATVFADFDGILVGKRDAAFYTSDPAADDDRADGCGVGFWKTHLLAWEQTPYSPGDEFDVTFGVTSTFTAKTLIGVLWQGGGDEEAFARQAVAALLNASHPGIEFGYSEAEVMELVLATYADSSFATATKTLDEMNDAFCTLGGDGLKQPGVGKPSFWHQHRHVWPLQQLFIGHKLYTHQHVYEYMQRLYGDDSVAASADDDITLELYAAVAASRLNIAAGNDAACIESTLDAADEWMAVNPVESNVSASDASWDEAASLLAAIDAYNSGELCVPAISADTRPQIFMPMLHDMNK